MEECGPPKKKEWVVCTSRLRDVHDKEWTRRLLLAPYSRRKSTSEKGREVERSGAGSG